MSKLTLSDSSPEGNAGGGTTNEIIDTLQIRSGNNDILAAIPAHRLVQYQHERDFKGEFSRPCGSAKY